MCAVLPRSRRPRKPASLRTPPACSGWRAAPTGAFVDTVNLCDALTGGNLLCTEQATSVVRGNMYDELRVSASGYQVYSTATGLVPPGSGLGSPYDVGGYGVGPYEASSQTTLLLRTFATVALCGNQPGVWAPGPFDVVPVS